MKYSNTNEFNDEEGVSPFPKELVNLFEDPDGRFSHPSDADWTRVPLTIMKMTVNRCEEVLAKVPACIANEVEMRLAAAKAYNESARKYMLEEINDLFYGGRLQEEGDHGILGELRDTIVTIATIATNLSEQQTAHEVMQSTKFTTRPYGHLAGMWAEPDQVEMLEETVRAHKCKVTECEEIINSLKRTISERERTVSEREGAISELRAMLSERNEKLSQPLTRELSMKPALPVKNQTPKSTIEAHKKRGFWGHISCAFREH